MRFLTIWEAIRVMLSNASIVAIVNTMGIVASKNNVVDKQSRVSDAGTLR
jgi:hypothetical protein